MALKEPIDEQRLRDFLNQIAGLPIFHDDVRVEVTTQGIFGDTPLHVAAVRGDVDAGRLLLLAGADINARGEHGYTPLHEAIEQEMSEFVRLLLDLGASPEIKTDDGLSANDYASQSDNAGIRIIFGYK